MNNQKLLYIFIILFNFVNLTAKIEVVNAWYGVDDPKYSSTNPSTSSKIVPQLRAIVNNYGFLVIPADQQKLYGFDPIPNVKKVTGLHLKENGNEQHLRATEGVDFIYPINTDPAQSQRALQEIKTKGAPAAPPSSSDTDIFDYQKAPNLWSETVKAEPGEKYDSNGQVFYFVKTGQNKIKLAKVGNVCAIVAYTQPENSYIIQNLETRSSFGKDLKNLIEGEGSEILYFNKSKASRYPEKELGLFSEICPEALNSARTLIVNKADPQKVNLAIKKINNNFRIELTLPASGQSGQIAGIIFNPYMFIPSDTESSFADLRAFTLVYSDPSGQPVSTMPTVSSTMPTVEIESLIKNNNIQAIKDAIQKGQVTPDKVIEGALRYKNYEIIAEVANLAKNLKK